MSQSEPGDHKNTYLPPEENREATCVQKLESKREGLPWVFWIWQLTPLAVYVCVRTPMIKYAWWIHNTSFGRLFAILHFTTWLSQGVLLTYWMMWGSGHWGKRTCKVIGLSILAALLPVIWTVRPVFQRPGRFLDRKCWTLTTCPSSCCGLLAFRSFLPS